MYYTVYKLWTVNFHAIKTGLYIIQKINTKNMLFKIRVILAKC